MAEVDFMSSLHKSTPGTTWLELTIQTSRKQELLNLQNNSHMFIGMVTVASAMEVINT